jgi:hypothetical protein
LEQTAWHYTTKAPAEEKPRNEGNSTFGRAANRVRRAAREKFKVLFFQ